MYNLPYGHAVELDHGQLATGSQLTILTFLTLVRNNQHWMKSIADHADAQTDVVLCGNKIDLEDARHILRGVFDSMRSL